MSIKLSIKDLKDLLKINKQAIKKKRRKRNKRLSKNTIDNNYNKSSSDHMKSTGFTNTSNEATELIRLQRQALEDKLKNDKEDRIKKDKADKADEQLKADKEGGLVPYDPLKNSGGSSDLRSQVGGLTQTLNYFMMGGMDGSTMVMPRHGKPGPAEERSNVGFIDDGPKIEEIKPTEGAVVQPSGDDEDEETTVNFTQKETTPAPKKQKSAMKNFIGMFTPTPKEEEKQPAEDPLKTLFESTKTSQKDVTVKNTAVGETEQLFDPDSLDIDKSTRNQLIGFINSKRGAMDTKLLNKSKPVLLDMAKSIKEEEAVEAKAKRKAARALKKG